MRRHGRVDAAPPTPSLVPYVLRAWLALLLLIVLAPLQAQSLAPLHEGQLPSLETGEPLRAIALVDGRPLAISDRAAWRLDRAGKAWLPLAWPTAATRIAGIIDDGTQAWLLTSAQHADDVTGVARLHASDQQLQWHALPPLPAPLRDARGAWSNDSLWIAGVGLDGKSQLLRLTTNPAATRWERLAGWPGDGAPSSVVALASSVLITVPGASGDAEQLWRWTSDAGWHERSQVPGRLLPGSGHALGQANAVYLLRDRGQASAPFRLMTFQTITGAWASLPGAAPADVIAVGAWPDGLLWAQRATGATRIDVGHASVQSSKLLLRWLDWIVLFVYLVGMIGIGLYFYLREKRNSTANFFVGGRSIPFWAAGISLYATNTSSISFIAIPAKAFETNWQYLTNNLIAVTGLMFVAVWVVPLLRRLDLMSVFSYLETRFHPAIRMLASALCIVMQIGSRMSVILFLPALAIATITGIDVTWSVLIMGGFTILYTTLGGMKAVIWTDFVQVFVMFGGALFAIGFIVFHVHGGVPGFIHEAMAEHKMHLLDFSFDLTKATVWGFIFLVLFDVVLTFPKDQVLMQRILSTRSDKEAGRSVWTFAAMMIPGGFVFYLIGTALFVFYKAHPERMNPTLPIDATFPLFIAAELPMGVTGLIIAAIFAAAMSTLSSIINSVSTLASVDFYEKLARNPTPKRSVLFAEIAGVAVGLIAIGLALLLSRLDIHSLFDVSIELAGLLGGGFAGAYTLGMFTRRANAPGVAIGIGSSICLTLLVWWFKLVHPYFYLAISIMLCIVIGYVASLFFPPSARSLKGLTIFAEDKA
ncbi:sodium:solute symporter family transporter [Rhodanobacter ginsengiterrae]|uniref:sodium:solute symporter n=1 Tax=Rhodanobacter ginsengiterrae TaxID=2008451 RepID=UPI003CEFBF7C